jgi:XTP/dITP diphosphohydrolase
VIEIVIATKNAGKVAEFAAALAELPVKVLSLTDFGEIPEAVEDGSTFAENAEKKARHYAHHTGKACLADDSGLEVDALGGAPGVYSARYAGEHATDSLNNIKLLDELMKTGSDNRSGRFRCALAFAADDGKIITADGICEGIILDKPRGNGGFGYDPLFYVPQFGKTFAELTVAEKNVISHRGLAIKNMAAKLVGFFR